jgi:tripartite-type tricarboxylate transporter receptor subunit TctC
MIKFSATFARTWTLGALMALAASAAAQQDYPNKPIRIITGYAAGGTTSIVARLVGQKLTESWGQQVLVDNRPGGGTIIGTEALAKSPPDGYTLMVVDSVHVLAPLLLKASYDPIKDFAPVATIAATELILLLHPSVPVNTLEEFIAYAKSRPGQLNYATPAIGGSQHLASEVLNFSAGITTQHIPYKGAGPALTGLIGGEVDMYFATTATAAPYIKSGKVKAMATTGKKRSPILPDVPTFDEAGLPNFYGQKRAPYGILAPAGTPKPIIDKLSAEIAKYLAQAEFRETLINLGLDPFLATPSEYAEVLKAGLAWNVETINILKKRNIKFEY